jgi:hypothetical protein
MKQVDLDALLRVRRERERKAEEAVARSLSAYQEAQQEAANLRRDAARHEAERRSRNAALYDALAGRRLSPAELERINTRLAQATEAAERRQARAAKAETEARRREGLVESARAALRDKRRDSVKWEELTSSIVARARRQVEQMSEMERDEESSDRFAATRAARAE